MQPSKLVIHIGSDKAGSTAIQEHLFANIDWYRSQGVHVPRALHRFGAGHADLFKRVMTRSASEELLAEPIETDGPIVLSWEGAHKLGENERTALRELLESWLPGVHIEFVFYARNQVDLAQTGSLQRVKNDSLEASVIEQLSRPFDELPPNVLPILENPRRKYHECLSTWLSEFPGSTMTARLYQRDRLVNGDIIDDFNSVLGVPTSGSDRPTSVANRSLTREAAAVLAQFHGIVRSSKDRLRAVDILLGWQEGTSSFLADDTRNAVAVFYQDDNDRLVEQFPACAGIDSPGSLDAEALDLEAVAACRTFLLAAGTHPTIKSKELTGTSLGQLGRPSGWEQVREVGLWASTGTSVLQFRPAMRYQRGYTTHVRIGLTGRYRGNRTATDDVRVNGTSLGPKDLRGSQIVVALGDAGPNSEIRLEFDHRGPTDHAPVDTTGRTFLLESFRCELIEQSLS